MTPRSMIKRGVAHLFPSTVVVNGSPRRTRSVAITFDDGPDPKNTPRILDLLDARSATATFFLQGNKAARCPDLVREIAARGHQVANHGYSHLSARATKRHEYVADVLRAQDTLEAIVGRELPRIFRPPFGHLTAATFLALLRRRFCFVFWSVDSMDAHLPDMHALVAHMKTVHISSGDILLLHDDYELTVDALLLVMSDLQERGYRLSSVRALLERR